MENGILRSFLSLTVGLLLIGCGSKGNSNSSTAIDKSESADAHASVMRELALPEVPESITEPVERAGYAVVHFWDALDPAEHLQSLDSAFMEQTFANFVGILPYATDEMRKEAVDTFADKCSADSSVYDLAVHITRHYLDDPNSPLRNEELYIPFLARFSSDPKLSEQKREHAAFRLEQAMKNRPGTRISDFRMFTRDGRTTTMLRELRDTTLIVFYDYDCEHCKETVTRLQEPEMSIRYPVIAVEVTEDREGWDSTKDDMPSGWTIAFATESLDGEKYYFPALPSIYLLTGDGTVIVKDGGGL